MSPRAPARRRLQAAAAGCAVLVALATGGPAYAGGSTGSMALTIRAALHPLAASSIPPPQPQAAIAASKHTTPPARASSSGLSAKLTLRIVPGSLTTGLQSLLAGDWLRLLPIWTTAGATYGVPWQVLAAINKVESNDGLNLGPSTAGAIGWMQFMPKTWGYYGVDANSDGFANPNDPQDAIVSAARYLAAYGARWNLPQAIYAYNHAWWYVDEVLWLAHSYGYSS
ncbi:MAG TPA: lytic transglycosylase domain-containing protein [Gaiellaceae bacterium]|nr:lytic transglycosylase domain-containing protein [Gaiellaceae bacterium]